MRLSRLIPVVAVLAMAACAAPPKANVPAQSQTTGRMLAQAACPVRISDAEAWVDFKLWGYAFPLVFIVGQGFYISRYISDDKPKA